MIIKLLDYWLGMLGYYLSLFMGVQNAYEIINFSQLLRYRSKFKQLLLVFLKFKAPNLISIYKNYNEKMYFISVTIDHHTLLSPLHLYIIFTSVETENRLQILLVLT